jgi:hypothetical protein
LFAALLKKHPNLVSHYKTPMDLVASIESHIHVEVKKIYPDAQLPTFDLEERTDNKLVMIYKSNKALYMMGKGLMLETFKLFNVPVNVNIEKLNTDGTEVRFIIEKI